MPQKHPKFVEPYQLTSSNFDNLGSIQFDGYDPTFPIVSLGQEFSTTSNVRFSTITASSEFLLGSAPLASYFPDGIGTKLPISGDAFVTGSFIIDRDLTIDGKLVAEEFHSELTNSSVIRRQGSTKFGDTLDDVHQFTGSYRITGGKRSVIWDYHKPTSITLNGYEIKTFASKSADFESGSLKRQDQIVKSGVIIPYAEANITLVQGELTDQDIMTRKNSYKSSTSITANTASFNAVTASNVDGYTNVGKNDFLFFYNGFVIEPNCYDIQQEGATFLLKIDVSQFGYDLTTNTAGQTPKVSAWGKFNA